MKKWIDKYNYSLEVDKPVDSLKTDIIECARNSKSLKIIGKNDNSINLELISKEALMVPTLPRYRASIEINKLTENKSTIDVQINGNSIISLFKYLGILLMIVIGAILLIINPFEGQSGLFPSKLPFLLGPIVGVFLFNFRNRSNIKMGHKEIQNIRSIYPQ